jgi:hypothetical protein
MQNSDQPAASPSAPATPPPAVPTPAPAKRGIGKRIPPQSDKSWRNQPGNANLNMQFKPTRSNAVRFIQARRAPGK